MADWAENAKAFLQDPAGAGVIGSLISLRWLPIGSSWAQKFWSLAGGMSVAYYLMPLCVEMMKLESKKAGGAFGFLGGFLGLLLLSRLWDYISTTPFGELLTSIFTRKPQQ